MTFRMIDSKEAIDFLLPRHYSGRVPPISYAFGWYDSDRLVAVCTFGKPASNSLCEGVCGKELKSHVYELNRLCRLDELNLQISQFVSACLKELKKHNLIIVSYSDTGMNHNGYIYQACNFIFTGTTKGRTDKYTEGNKHSRHYKGVVQGGKRKVRTPKNRYVYFATDRKTRREYLSKLKYPICKYPKSQNTNYILGTYMKPEIITNL